MGGWKTRLRVSDLADDDRLELLCRKCGQSRYLVKAELEARKADQLHLDEVEHRSMCRVFGCKGRMRMALIRSHKVSAFIGGMA